MNDVSQDMFFKTKDFTECTAGLYGDNCLALCPYPSFGVLCNETCDCSKPACHHAYGCKTTTLISAGRNNYAASMGFISVP